MPGSLLRIWRLQEGGGSLYLSGTVQADSGVLTLGAQIPGKPRTWLLLDKGTDVTDEDDETLEEPSGKLDSKDAVLCVSSARHIPRRTHDLWSG